MNHNQRKRIWKRSQKKKEHLKEEHLKGTSLQITATKKRLAWIHSYLAFVVTGIIAILIGILIGCCITSESILLFFMVTAGILLMIILCYCYYRYEMARVLIDIERRHRYMRYLYWGTSFLIFVAYLVCCFDTYRKTYEPNMFGLDQSQYIILVNFSLYFVIAILVYQIVRYQYVIKNISKDGIVLEKIEEDGLKALDTNTTMVSNISDLFLMLDHTVKNLYDMNYVDIHISYEEYKIIISNILQPITVGCHDVFVMALSEEEYKEYVKEMKYTSSMKKKLLYNLENSGIMNVDNNIHIKYALGDFHEFSDLYIYIVMELNSMYDINMGKLVYSYIRCFEALYSKYALINSI